LMLGVNLGGVGGMLRIDPVSEDVCARTEISAHKCLVMTGGTSGIGRRVLERLLTRCQNWTIILLARQSARSRELWGMRHCERLTVIETDLASLKSVDRACDDAIRSLGSHGIDALALNAGIQTVSTDAASADGLELAFAVNFLAHFLIVERLKAHMRPGGRIVSTTSEVHDPEAFCLMGIGRATWQDPVVLADPVKAQQNIASNIDRGEARYCASKLLNLMHVRHLAREIPTIGVVAYNPSVVPGTEIARDRNWMQRLGWKYVLPLLSPILLGTRSIERSSGDLLWLLTDADTQSMSGKYVDGREIRAGSLESRDHAKIARSVEVAKRLLNERLYNKPEKQRTTKELALPTETAAHAVAINSSAPFG
jgi:NAD(P)-dependent dehydrogenase (short-subunit alcohol dehydrogenase family)